jgi:hypothetical protein
MGFFNVLKGAYPSLRQLDKTLPIGSNSTAITRGSCMKIGTVGADAGKFVIANNDNGAANVPGPVIYFAFQNYADPDVKMAGGITGMPCLMPCEVETDQFDQSNIVAGSFLMSGAAGALTLHLDDRTAVGVCTKAASYRWSNQAPTASSDSTPRTGDKIQTIAFWTMYAPNLSTGA